MFINKFVDALIPSIRKNEILEDIDATIAEINDLTLPPYASAFDASLFTETYNPKSKWLSEKQRLYRRSGVSRYPTLHMYINGVLSTLPDRLEFFRKHMSSGGESVVAAGIDYQTAAVVHFVSIAGFMARYARRFLLLSYAQEMPEYFKSRSIDMPFSKIELKMMEDQYDGFMGALQIFSMPTDKMIQKISEIPEYTVEDEAVGLTSSTGGGNLEPIPVGFVPYRMNPIYHIRMAIADWQHSRYLAAKDERQALDLRLLALKATRDSGGELPPSLEKQIEVTEKRVMNLNRKLIKMES